jgi:exodeoxyribonuclease VII large subunit
MDRATRQTENAPQVYRVSELTRSIKTLLERNLGLVWVEGEMSNVRLPSSGHCYFTIKDENAQIQAVLFRMKQRDSQCPLKDGVQVRAFGQVTVYEKGGNYQLIVQKMEEAGKGALQARFEALKEKLRLEGLFEPGRKKALPALPRHIGIVTSPTGAAIQDIFKVIFNRFPNLHLVLAPVRVQGEGAAAEIAAAIDGFNERGGMDVLIVGRGGGSLEDLWAFNEEVVARAIARSKIPVISAVGHEIDFTISDFVADLRAATPSAAAELVVRCKADFEEQLARRQQRLAQALTNRFLTLRNRLLTLNQRGARHEPTAMILRLRQTLEAVTTRLVRDLENRIRDRQQELDEQGVRMAHAMAMRSQMLAQEVRRFAGQLQALSPWAVLQRGYSVTLDAAGHVVQSARALRPGDAMTTRLADGRVTSVVSQSEAGKPSGKA